MAVVSEEERKLLDEIDPTARAFATAGEIDPALSDQSDEERDPTVRASATIKAQGLDL